MKYLILIILFILCGCLGRSPKELRAIDEAREACDKYCSPRKGDWGHWLGCQCVVENK